jgi:hypothetical protein
LLMSTEKLHPGTGAWSFVSKLITKLKMQLKIKWVEINKPTLLSPHKPLQTSPWSRGHLQVRVTSCTDW